MVEGHERFEALTLAHALGGLSAADRGSLRSHLVGCAACRARLVELDALSDELAAAARDERRRAAAPRRRSPVDLDLQGDGAGEVATPRAVRRGDARPGRTVAALVAVAAAVALGFWNLHLRAAAATYFAAADERGTVLETLARGVLLEPTVLGAAGRVAVTEASIALVLTDVGALRSDERIVLWRTRGGGEPWSGLVLVAGPQGSVDVVRQVDRDGAEEVRVTVERGLLGEAPGGRVLVAATLPPA